MLYMALGRTSVKRGLFVQQMLVDHTHVISVLVGLRKQLVDLKYALDSCNTFIHFDG